MFIEHVNLTVSDLERAIAFYRDLFGYSVRWKGKCHSGQPAAHVGDERCYLALFEAPSEGRAPHDYDDVGLNHVAFVVEDFEAVKQRLKGLGVDTHLEADYEPGRRFYFFDPDGIEVEIVTYDPAPA